MEVGRSLHGFTLTRVRNLPELKADCLEMEHDKTGARLCFINRADDNKAFAITFKTIPEDSTGVFHILEHSVLCGSRKYPVKEPFVELLKSSVQTFLNAMTFNDKTVYPVSSRNDQDFLNLMDIYLDAVFHPAIYHNPNIFHQEGWRYEFVEGQPEKTEYQGVVLNEMKGVYSSPDSILESSMDEMLFPDTCYRHDSGGKPEHIPELSYEQFIATHKKFYHPSNALISLVGSVNLDATLEKINGFLSEFERRNIDLEREDTESARGEAVFGRGDAGSESLGNGFEIPMQKPAAAVLREAVYEIGTEEALEGRSIIAGGTLLGTFETKVRNYAAAILADYLAGDNDSPLKRAILDAGLGQDVRISVHDGTLQSYVTWEVWNTNPYMLDNIRQVMREYLSHLLEQGLDKERLEACYNHFAFRMRDKDGSGMPRSVGEAIDMLEDWLYGGDPAGGLLVEDPLLKLGKKLESDYFSELIRELFLDESHTATLVLKPSHTEGLEKAARERERLEKVRSFWTDKELDELKQQANELICWQQTPDSREVLATIPMLALSDLNECPGELPLKVSKKGPMTILHHETGSNLVYLHAHFDASDLSAEELPLLAVLSQVLGSMATKEHESEKLQLLVKQKTGRLSFQPNVVAESDEKHCRVYETTYLACLADQAKTSIRLLNEILLKTMYTDRRLLRDVLRQAAMEAQMSLSANGHAYAITRLSAYQSAHGLANEYIGGLTFAKWLKAKSSASDEELDSMLESLKALAKRIFIRSRLTVSCSENVDEELLDLLCVDDNKADLMEIVKDRPKATEEPIGRHSAKKENDYVAEAASYSYPGNRQEGILIPSGVGFAGLGGNLKGYGKAFHGSLMVLANILNFDYLWSEIRVQGGAYGCGFMGKDDGDVAFYTYRDPKPGRSLDVMKKAAAYVREFCEGDPDLTGYILSAVSNLDPLLNTFTRIVVAENRYLKGTGYDDVCRYYGQLLHTSKEDLLELCSVLDAMAENNSVCVVAGKDHILECGERLSSHINL